MSEGNSKNRYWTIDALRGIAALAVALYHIDLVSLAKSDGIISSLLNALFHYGYLGVSIFFVISGFVIASSTANGPITFGYFGKFILKRSIRLDPTYWSSIALDIILTVVAVRFFAAHTPLPDVKKVLLHLFYLQDLAGVGNIAAIYWTLCLEVQFYIVFCVVLAIDNKLSSRYASGQRRPNFKIWLFAAITLYSMLVASELVPSPLRGLFITHWILFAMGAAAYNWGMRDKTNRWVFPGILAGMAIVFLLQVEHQGAIYAMSLAVASITAIILYAGAIKEKLGSWLKNDVLLYLGARSYSIYLFHTIVGERTAELLLQVIYPKLGLAANTQGAALIAFTVGVGFSLIVAEVAYRLIEMPSLVLSKRIRPSRTGSPVKELVTGLPV
jgi:peptidoglycan/LPS O-acetylase OafA/YrhL